MSIQIHTQCPCTLFKNLQGTQGGQRVYACLFKVTGVSTGGQSDEEVGTPGGSPHSKWDLVLWLESDMTARVEVRVTQHQVCHMQGGGTVLEAALSESCLWCH